MIDIQWGDLHLEHIEQPVLNFIKPITNHFVAQIISDDIALNVEVTNGTTEEEALLIPKILNKAIDRVIENANVKYHNRRAIRNAVLDGDACMHVFFDPSIDTGEAVKGDIKVELLDNTNVYFGDTSSGDVQSQPYIILAYRRLVDQVKKQAEKNGLDPGVVQADSDDYLHANLDKETNAKYTTVLRRMWKEERTGTVWCSESVRGGYITEPFDLEYYRYPISWYTWEEVKNSCHGKSPITGKIPNQQYINKIYAMAMHYTKKYAFPKIVYDAQKLPGGWNNDIGKAIAVNGNPRDIVLFDTAGAGAFNSQAIDLAERVLTQTKELMGASDAALGNVKPDNMGAIIAVQNAANIPIDVQRMVFHQFIDEYQRIMLDVMRVNYGTRSYNVTLDNSEEKTGSFDFSVLNKIHMKLKTEVGQGSYWSELKQIQTLDALQRSGLIPDAITYFEVIPEGYIPNKQKIIDKWKSISEAQLPAQPTSEPLEAQGNNAGATAAEEIAKNSFVPEISDEDLAELMAELATVQDESKQQEIISKLNVSEESKQIILQLLKGGEQNAVPQM